jgi:hypothetical protein
VVVVMVMMIMMIIIIIIIITILGNHGVKELQKTAILGTVHIPYILESNTHANLIRTQVLAIP